MKAIIAAFETLLAFMEGLVTGLIAVLLLPHLLRAAAPVFLIGLLDVFFH